MEPPHADKSAATRRRSLGPGEDLVAPQPAVPRLRHGRPESALANTASSGTRAGSVILLTDGC